PLDLVGLLEDDGQLADRLLVLGDLLALAIDLGLGLVGAAAGVGELTLAGGQDRDVILKLAEGRVVLLDALVEGDDLGVQAVAVGVVGGAGGELGVGLADAVGELAVAAVAPADLVAGPLLEAVVLGQLQDLAEDLLALGRGASGEGVGAALEDERGVG